MSSLDYKQHQLGSNLLFSLKKKISATFRDFAITDNEEATQPGVEHSHKAPFTAACSCKQTLESVCSAYMFVCESLFPAAHTSERQNVCAAT